MIPGSQIAKNLLQAKQRDIVACAELANAVQWYQFIPKTNERASH
jgi:hypothetical protein